MSAAIKALEDHLSCVQTDIVSADNRIAERRKEIDSAKERLKTLYKTRDELASAIYKLRRSR